MGEPCLEASNEFSDQQHPANEKCEFIGGEVTLFYVMHVVLAILVLFSLITNGFVIYIFSRKKFGRVTTAKILYANMSLSDELAILTWIFQVTIPEWNSVPIWIQALLRYSSPIAGFVSAYTMVLIAFKRYQVVYKPFKHLRGQDGVLRDASRKWFYVYIGIIWLASTGVSIWLYPFVEVAPFDDSYFSRICAFISSRLEVPFLETFLSLVLLAIVPFALGMAFALITSYRLYKVEPPGHIDLKTYGILRARRIKSILMILSVVVIFAAFESPVVILYAVESLRYKKLPFCDYNYYLHGAFLIMFLTAFILNPIVYWFLNEDFQVGLRTMLASICRRPRPPVHNVATNKF